MNNYVIYHLHSDLSSCVTSIDSVTKPKQYIDKAAELGMKALAFSEHGSAFMWVKKKEMINAAGMKYIHAEEFYLTESLDEKIKDNYHCCIIAKNYDGVLELNALSSSAFNREDGHYYYVPRITLNQLFNTSDNLMITSACLGGPLSKGTDDVKRKVLQFFIDNKHRCFLEIQHHIEKTQIYYNRYLHKISLQYGIPLIAGTDTHALNQEHLEARSVLQKAKNIHFEDEDAWDLVFKSYDELIEAYQKQNSLNIDIVKEAIENTNKMADQVEDFELDRSYKYPHLWENSEKLFIQKIKAGIKRRGVDKYPNREEYADRIKYEMKAYKHNQAIDFMLLMEDIVSWCREQDIPIGYGRGSVNGSVIAWLLGITEMDSIKHNLNFDRFMNIARVSLSDIDTDYPPSRINDVKNYIFNRHGLYCSDIATFNTIADKGAIRDVCRGLYKNSNFYSRLSPKWQKEYDNYQKNSEYYNGQGQSLPMSDALKNEVNKASGDYLKITGDVLTLFEQSEDDARSKYPDVFKYVDLLKGVVVSVGSHPCGVITAPFPINDRLGLFTTTTDAFPISQVYMKEVDSLNYVKLDCLKLDTIELISETCKLVGIPMVTPDNLDIYDIDVWNSMRDDTTAIFQWEGKTGDQYIKQLMSDENIEKFKKTDPNIDRMTLLSIGNSAIRPAGASYRNDLGNGVVRKSGSQAIDDFLKPTFGYLVFQCQIIEFLHNYCGFTMGEADIVRRHFAKKTGTENDIPIIKDGGYMTDKKEHYIPGFVATMKEKYSMTTEEAEETITSFLKVIEDASAYLFSINHSCPYTYEGYACGWLRYHYPTEFLTCAFNINKDNEEKTNALTVYAKKNGVNIQSIKFRHSIGEYSCDVSSRTIYKGLSSIKYMSDAAAEDLYSLKDRQYEDFMDLLADIKELRVDSRQLDILIKLDFFSEFGQINKLLADVEIFNKLYGRKTYKVEKLSEIDVPLATAVNYCQKSTEKTLTGLDWKGLAKEAAKHTDPPKTSILDHIRYENEFLGYIQTVRPKASEDYYYVQAVKGYNNNTLILYQLKTGDIMTVKNRSKKEVLPNTIIKAPEFIYDHKYKKDENGKWITLDEREYVIKKLSFVT